MLQVRAGFHPPPCIRQKHVATQQGSGGNGSIRNRPFRMTKSGRGLRGARLYSLSFGAQPAEGAHDCKELRASAAPRLRPARPFQGRISSMPLNLCPRAAACEAPARADAKADASCGPSRGEAAARRSLRDRFCRCILIVRYSGCSLRSARTAFSRPKFKIHDSKFKIQNHELRNVLTGNKLLAKRRASLIVRYSGKQPAERAQVRVRTAGLRRPQAAARRSLRDRDASSLYNTDLLLPEIQLYRHPLKSLPFQPRLKASAIACVWPSRRSGNDDLSS